MKLKLIGGIGLLIAGFVLGQISPRLNHAEGVAIDDGQPAEIDHNSATLLSVPNPMNTTIVGLTVPDKSIPGQTEVFTPGPNRVEFSLQAPPSDRATTREFRSMNGSPALQQHQPEDPEDPDERPKVRARIFLVSDQVRPNPLQ